MDNKQQLEAIQNDFIEVRDVVKETNKSVIEIGKNVAVLCSDVDRHEKDIQKIRDREITVAMGLRKPRSEVPPPAPVPPPIPPPAPKSYGTLASVLIKAIPYILFIGAAIGAFAASGGDSEKTDQTIKKMYDATIQLEQRIMDIETDAPRTPPERREPAPDSVHPFDGEAAAIGGFDYSGGR